MSDKQYVGIFVAIGLVLAYIVSAPLRNPKEQRLGTPLRGGSTMATSEVKSPSS